jgi:uncharacterized FAD-dependent dehydrogenase
MKKSVELTVSLDDVENTEKHQEMAATTLRVRPNRITTVRIRKRSIDARRTPIRMHLQADVYIDETPPAEILPTRQYPNVSGKPAVVIVGCGPAGMFAALRLIELGFRPIILERGKDVQARRRDLANINRYGIVNHDSNYCFGEGGAGTYSDGKLYTRATKRGRVEGVLETLVAHGAKPEILVDTHPHIGSNKLPEVVKAMRESILNAGGEIHFEHRVVDFVLEQGAIHGVVTANGNTIMGEAVILATGHSARDIFQLLVARGVKIEAKPFAMGVRIEHPQPLIDRIQYHTAERHPNLPAASYRLAYTVQERGVFSFCMCPGGWIVPSATEGDEVVVNGMSLSRRDSAYANSGMVVAIEPEDLGDYAAHGDLAGIAYQRAIETMANRVGGGTQKAPAQRVPDFVNSKISDTLPDSSYKPGLTSVPLHETLPPAIAHRLQEGLAHFGRIMPGYMTDEAVIVGVESRTSSPVRVPRDDHSLEHPEVRGFYPCGEGAGYAGGIVSAALDGIRVAEAIAKSKTTS